MPCFPSTARILANLPPGMLLLMINIMNIIKIRFPIKLRACVLENGLDLHINERQKIRHYRIRSIKEIARYFVNGAIIAMLYTHLIRIINNNNNRPPACTSTSLWDRKQGIKEWWPNTSYSFWSGGRYIYTKCLIDGAGQRAKVTSLFNVKINYERCAVPLVEIIRYIMGRSHAITSVITINGSLERHLHIHVYTVNISLPNTTRHFMPWVSVRILFTAIVLHCATYTWKNSFENVLSFESWK